MEEVIYQCNLDNTLAFLEKILKKHAPNDALDWLNNKQKEIFKDLNIPLYFMTFSAISSYFSKEELALSHDELLQASKIRDRWQPKNWSVVQFARTFLVIGFARHHLERFKETLDKIFSAADVHELIALYQGLPLFPYPQKFLLHATNGIRSNMLSVFDAIALNNPYPTDYFDEISWNQLVLKTLFVDSPIEEVIGLKAHVNPALCIALINTARERFAADRPIKPELWCLVGLSLDKETWPLLKNLWDENNLVIKGGILIACDHAELPEAKKFFDAYIEKNSTVKNLVQKLHNFEQQLS